VKLVGILDADSLLGFADFRVNERAFQLMEQVSGRAGRKGTRGKVMIQVANTKAPGITIYSSASIFPPSINLKSRAGRISFIRLSAD
jgi:primosomal protein N'